MRKLNYKYIYHCHTPRCGHATGEEEEIVKLSIKQGVKLLLFTDHAPFPNYSCQGIRMEYEELDEYVASINSLKEKYKDKIEIHVGLEYEYLIGKSDVLDDYLTNHGIEFIIIGQHIFYKDDMYIWTGDEKFSPQYRIQAYTESIIEALDKGYSHYLAHPDLLCASTNSFSKEVEEALRKIMDCVIRNDAYIEFNIHGIKNNNLSEFGYPNRYFWKMVKKDYPSAKIVIGLDVHSPEEITDNIWLEQGLEVLKELGIKYKKKLNFDKDIKYHQTK